MEKNKQQQFMELQVLAQQINQLHQQSQMIQQQFAELKALKENLADLEQTKPNTNSFSLLGAGIFIESEVKNTKHVLMNVGSQVLVKKTITQAKELIQHQEKEVENILINIEHQIHETTNKAQQLESELQ